MPPRQPSKNRINMHDIVAQPLTALPDAVDAILRRPEALDEQEVGSIFHECSYIFLRAEEALSVKDGDAFCALFKLLSEGFAHDEGSFEEGVKTFALHGPLLQTVHALFRAVVEQGALPMHSAGTVELVQVMGSLCDGEAIRDTCGSLFMKGLGSFLARIYADPTEADKHFHVQRGVATALINLVKGSKQNKLRLPSWTFVAECCAASVDVFFQFQCIELLFRVSRQKQSVLAQLGGALSPHALEQLRALPNDGTLLLRMASLIEDMNSGRPDVLRYPLSQVVAAETVLTEGTDAYFTPHYLIVMVTSSSADNITIPYRIIRSITLGKDGRVIIKLEEFPVKLEVLLSHTAGMDTVTLYMPLDLLAKFKQSPIRTWMVAALTARREAAKAAATVAAAAPPTAGVKRSSDGEVSPPSANGNEEEVDRAPGKMSVSIKALTVGGAAAADDSQQKKQRTEGPPPPAAGSGAPAAVVVGMIDAIAARSTAKETQAIYAQLRRLIDAKIELHKGEAVAALNDIMGGVQAKVDAARRGAEEGRGAWQQAVRAEVERLDAHIGETQGVAAAAVERLNEDLCTIKQNNQALNQRIAGIEVELQRTLEESRGTGAVQARELKALCDREIEARAYDIDQRLLSRASSATVLSAHMQAVAQRGSFT